MALASGTRVGIYEVTAKIGEGGMGEVYQARDTALDRDVALKVLPEAFTADPERLARFQREAKVLASLNHPNIGGIYGLESSGDAQALVLELIEGPTLADRISKGPLPIDEALAIAQQIAEALEAAHEQGIIHRDLKPANVKVKADGTVKVLDFGLAKAVTSDAASGSATTSATMSLTASSTQMGTVIGTAAYMAPEQARGQIVDKRADIWAFGVVLFEMFTGRGTFGGGTVSDVLAGVLVKEPQWNTLPPSLHPRIRLLLERCVEKNCKDRYGDISDARVDVQKVLSDPDGVTVQPVVSLSRATPRSKMGWVGVTVFVASVAVAATWVLKPLEPGTVTRFTYTLPEGQLFSNENGGLLAVSPDGSTIVYAASGQLHIREMDALESTPILGTDENPFHPFFSPDGEWIGYWARDDQQLKKIGVGGGAPVVLSATTDVYGTPRWGSDDTIVWVEQGAELVDRLNVVRTVSGDGGASRLLFTAEGGNFDAEAQILPDGETVLYTDWQSDLVAGAAASVALHSLVSGERTVLFPGEGARFLPTGHLVYAVGGVLVAVPFDPEALEITGGPVSLVEGVRRNPMQYGFSESGSLVYVRGGTLTDDRLLALVDRDGRVEPLNIRPGAYASPRVSPDGTRLAVQTLEPGGESAIWLYDMSGRTQIRRLVGEGNNSRPVWTPDGQRITFMSDRSGTPSIYWQAADGSGVAEQLTTADEGLEHRPESWSADGRTLIFTEGLTGTEHLWSLSLDADSGPEPFHVLDDSRQTGGVFSPDGDWVAYGSTEDGNWKIFLQPFPQTGAVYPVIEENGLYPVWSSDGGGLLFRRGVSGFGQAGGEVRRVDLALNGAPSFSAEERLGVEGFLFFNGYRDYDTMPDGEDLVMVFPVDMADSDPLARAEINVVLNWFEELKERVPVP